ncbi:hypothetical protein K432DRAFT_255324, partial [Lepidopterella palustris CBS 459.81]
VEFYSQDRVKLGDKTSLEQQIQEITGIAVEVLRGRSLHTFGIQERFRGKYRQTKKEEDYIYCLLGIFDVSLPLVYGEGRRHAMRRLQEEI